MFGDFLDRSSDGAGHVEARSLGCRPRAPIAAAKSNCLSKLASQGLNLRLGLLAPNVIPLTKKIEVSSLAQLVKFLLQL